MFEWLKRYRECGVECHVCARTCTVQAIHPLGQINPNECIYCLKCQANYFDHDICLHLKKRAARRQPLAAAPVPNSAGARPKEPAMRPDAPTRRRVITIFAAAAASAVTGGPARLR